MSKDPDKFISFHYVKGPSFQTNYANGIYGGITPSGMIDVNFYLERGPIPRIIQFALNEEEGLLQESFREGKEGWIRETNVGVLLDVQTSKNLIDWLTDRIAEIEGRSDQSPIVVD